MGGAHNQDKEGKYEMIEDTEVVLLGAVKQANDGDEPFRFDEDMIHIETDSPTWRDMVAAGLVTQDEDGGWRITKAGRERLA